jgi:hypothetical protein
LGPISNNSHSFIQELIQAGEKNSMLANDLNKLQVLNESVESLLTESMPLIEKGRFVSIENRHGIYFILFSGTEMSGLRQNNDDLTKILKIQEDQLTELKGEVERYERCVSVVI